MHPFLATDEQIESYLNQKYSKSYMVAVTPDTLTSIANAWVRYINWSGRMNEIAQTRTASSYGFLQMLYSTAYEKGYKINQENLPENLQIPEKVFTFAIPYLIDRLKEELRLQKDNDNYCWTLGFEKTWRIAFSRYNCPGLRNKKVTESNRLVYPYGIDVLQFSNQYLSH